MRALRVAQFFGIPIFIHWSFVLVLVFIGYMAVSESMSILQLGAFTAYVMTLFICVIMHEYGHALMARRYGIETQDIIIAPIGGIARLQGLPSRPVGELMVALAGPLVNLVLAVLIYIVLWFLGAGIIAPDPDTVETIDILTNPFGFLNLIFLLNVVLFLFNLIPAYPMDGGRVLRAILSLWMTKLKATFYASVLGRILAVGFVVFSIYNGIPSLILIGIFVYVMAGREYNYLSKQANRDF